MTSLHAIILGIIQGITEFLPVSSSAHLMFASKIMGLANQRYAFDVCLNLGSLLAIAVFFRKDIWRLILGFFNRSPNDRKFFNIWFVSSVPTIVIFFIADLFLDINFKSPILLTSTLISFGIILYLCDLRSENKSSMKPLHNELFFASARKDADTRVVAQDCNVLLVHEDSLERTIACAASTEANCEKEPLYSGLSISMKDGILVGLAQSLAIIPGVSRLGATLSASRYLNYSRSESFRFSMLLSIPPVSGALFITLLKIIRGKIIIDDWSLLFIGCLFSFLFGLVSLRIVTNFLKKHTLLAIVIYRIIFGISVWLLNR